MLFNGNLRSERLDSRPERLDLRPERLDLRPEAGFVRLEKLPGGTDGRTDVRTYGNSPLCPTGHRPFGAAAQKGCFRLI